MDDIRHNIIPIARQVFEIEAEALRVVGDSLDRSFQTVVLWSEEALNTGHKLVFAGVGKSGNVSHKIVATLTSTGSPAIFLSPLDALHGDIGIVQDGDVIYLLSYSGESTEMLNLISALKRFNVKLIAITGNAKSSVSRFCDSTLTIKVPKEACPFNLAPTSSSTATLAMGDALAMTLMRLREFTRENYAKYHPSGAIGRSLLMTVKDIMRIGKRHPIVSVDCLVREGILKMTEARSGSLTIIDKNGKLVGIFADGDLRRHLSQDPYVLERRISEVMTPNPISISENAMAAEALKLFNSRNIDDLIVVNSKGEPTGLVDSQDLPKMKL